MHIIFEVLSVLHYTWIACNGTKSYTEIYKLNSLHLNTQ